MEEDAGKSIHNTQVTDNGLMHLKGLTKLEYLSLDGTKVTDAGLENLKGMRELKFLFGFERSWGQISYGRHVCG